MTPKRLIEILTSYYRKVTNIFFSICHWLFTYIEVVFSKIFHPKQETVCILLAEHFGDIVACEPLSREIRKLYPTAKIYWIVRKPYRELLDYNPNIDVIIEEFSVLYSMLMAWKSPFTHFYNCHLPHLRFYTYLRNNLKNPKAEAMGILKSNYYNHGNLLEIFAKVGGLPFVNEAPKMYIPEKVKAKINQLNLPDKFIVIHCHSNSLPREWQDEFWKKLILDLIQKFDYHIIEIGLESTLNISNKNYHNFCGKCSLLETAEVISRAKYFIGIDSGPAHLANAVGTFGLLLFGKFSNFENYMPYSGDYSTKKNAKFIAQKGRFCSELDYDFVWSEISEKVK